MAYAAAYAQYTTAAAAAAAYAQQASTVASLQAQLEAAAAAQHAYGYAQQPAWAQQPAAYALPAFAYGSYVQLAPLQWGTQPPAAPVPTPLPVYAQQQQQPGNAPQQQPLYTAINAAEEPYTPMPDSEMQARWGGLRSDVALLGARTLARA